MFGNIFVKDWMTHHLVTAERNMGLSEAHKLMKEKQIRRLLVVDSGKLLGLVTLGDVREASPSDATTLSIWELNYLWAQLKVDKVMTRNLHTVSPETPIVDAAELMLEHKISGLPVVDGDQTLVGVITESDIFRMLVRSRNQVEAQ